MRIAEIYKSLQGEGFLTGTESIFIRTSGCNLRCWFCDTPYASWKPEGDDLSVRDILKQIQQLDCGHIVLTGGEPMLPAESIPLCEALRATGKHITIETAGTLYLPLEADLMSISPKLSNSTPTTAVSPSWIERHQQTRHRPQVIRQLLEEYAYQLKFVIDTPDDCEEVQAYLVELPGIERSRVMMMPQGTDVEMLERIGQWLEPYCQQEGFVFCARRQFEWFGLARGV